MGEKDDFFTDGYYSRLRLHIERLEPQLSELIEIPNWSNTFNVGTKKVYDNQNRHVATLNNTVVAFVEVSRPGYYCPNRLYITFFCFNVL